MKTIDFLTERKNETHDLIQLVNNEFSTLQDRLFYTKPEPKKWSVAECLDHLILTLDIYIPQMVQIIDNKGKYIGQKENFNYTILGRLAVKSMKPKKGNIIPFKMKTFKNLIPLKEGGKKQEIIERFVKFQKEIINVIGGLKDVNLEKPKIITAAGPILKMRLGDALHFMVAHNQRHILQAQNVLRKIQ